MFSYSGLSLLLLEPVIQVLSVTFLRPGKGINWLGIQMAPYLTVWWNFQEINIIIWATAFVLGYLVIYGLNLPEVNNFQAPQPLSKAAVYMYGGLHRLTWGIAVGWVVFACCRGYGGKHTIYIFTFPSSIALWIKINVPMLYSRLGQLFSQLGRLRTSCQADLHDLPGPHDRHCGH